ncbi:MAG: hypothetical protein ABI454_13250 [Sphingomicrobium sp.]
MAYREWIAAFGMVIAAVPVSATTAGPPTTTPAPPGTAETRYCLRVEPQTGSRIESVECWTREEWAEGGVDVDQEWAKEGVRVLT